jgi:large subunit ribosomal protein L15
MALNLHTLVNAPNARRRKIRLGRGIGSGKGKTCGRGHKGQMARKGHKRKLGFEGGQMRLVRRLPKRGFKSPAGTRYATVNVGALVRFAPESEVNAQALRACGLVRGRADGIKILGDGDIDRKLTVKAQAFSGGARSKIEAAGGVCEVVPA